MFNPYIEEFEGNPSLVKRNGLFIPQKIEEISNEEHALAIYKSKAIDWLIRLYLPLSISSIELFSLSDVQDSMSIRINYTNKLPPDMRKMKRDRISHWPYGCGDTHSPFTEINGKENETDDIVIVCVCHLLMDYIEKKEKKADVESWREFIEG